MAVNVLHIMLTIEIAFSGLMCLINLYIVYCRSQWLRGLKCESGVTSLMGLRVRIPPAVCPFVSCECCVLSVRGLCDGPITRPEES
jgi:hypothetical protein